MRLKETDQISPLLVSLKTEDREDLAVCLTTNNQEGPSTIAPEFP